MNLESTITLHTGNTMSVMGLGTWQLTRDAAGTVEYALQLGYRLIDTSSDYGSQPGIGVAIKNSTINREHIYLITKVEETDDAYAAAKAYLQEMDQEYADLILIHRPPSIGVGEKLWAGLIQAKKEGYTKDIGVSNYSTVLIDKLISVSGEVPVVNQIEWSPFGFSPDMKKYCDDKQIFIQAYSPLTRTKRLNDETLTQLGQKYRKSPAQILIRWNLQLGTVPIPKANQKDHLEENLQVFDFKLSNEDIERLNGLNERYSSLGFTLEYL